jgi:hypothetical protein
VRVDDEREGKCYELKESKFPRLYYFYSPETSEVGEWGSGAPGVFSVFIRRKI